MAANVAMSGADTVSADAGAQNSRSDRKAAKGRRRRAAAEQRRIEQQRWGKYLDDEDEDYAVLAPITSSARRRARRRSDRESLSNNSFDHALEEELDPDLALSMALALSLSSIAEGNPGSQGVAMAAMADMADMADMSYESLVQLENVSCVASDTVVASLPVLSFVTESATVCEVCVICQGEYDHGDCQVTLPCLHTFHQTCGAEWLLNYSKLCPVCKHDVTEVASV